MKNKDNDITTDFRDIERIRRNNKNNFLPLNLTQTKLRNYQKYTN